MPADNLTRMLLREAEKNLRDIEEAIALGGSKSLELSAESFRDVIAQLKREMKESTDAR